MTYWIAGAAAVGALVDRKQPLRGAALGAGAMFTGGAALGVGAGAGAGAAGAAGAGAAGAGAAGAGAAGGGLLGASAAGAGTAGALGAAELGAVAAPTLAGTSGAIGGAEAVAGSSGLLGGTQAAAPVVEMGSSASLLDKANFATGNMFSPGGLVEGANKVAKPIGDAMSTAQMFQPEPKPEMPIVPPPMVQQAPQTGPQGLAQLAGQNQAMNMQQMQTDAADKERRKRQIAGMGGLL